MRKILMVSLLCCCPPVFGNTAAPAATSEKPDSARCEQLRQLKNPDMATQQLLQQHCTAVTAAPSANIMPVQLETPQPTPPAPTMRVQHNSTLEWLGSSMLLVLLGFWLWMGRR